ncbi:MAG: hypothetical protein VX640_05385 [Pseudomonadota bacterium]|nr:hypothetical protein [Pseudomonadota bacterium]
MRHLTIKSIAAGLVGAVFAAGAASAAPVTFVFQNPGADLPVAGNYTTGGTCNGISISGPDLCTINHAVGLDYAKDWAGVNVIAKTGAGSTALIQDLSPTNSGLGALTQGETNSDDQVQFSKAESLVFTFASAVKLLEIDFNAGADTNCATPGGEGPCGTFDLIVDGFLVGDELTAIDNMLFASIVGQVFQVIATGPSFGGFTVGSITVDEVPVPGAALLLLSGLAGLGFAGRRKARA